MKVLIVGDIVGLSGMIKLKERLSSINKNQDIDFIIVNGENSANGKGIRIKEYNDILSYNVDVITMGNHLYYRKEMADEYIKLNRLVIPANVTDVIGNKNIIIEKNGVKFGITNLIGTFGMGERFEKNTLSPFKVVTEQIEILKSNDVDYIFVDFHAEATAEKIAMGYFLDGIVTCIFGTHTHVQTADEKILKSGTAYITDIGMTGPTDSVIGLSKEVAMKRYVNNEHAKYECSNNKAIFNAIMLDIEENTKKVKSIIRINE